jgi:hypothetical protein
MPVEHGAGQRDAVCYPARISLPGASLHVPRQIALIDAGDKRASTATFT